MHPNNPYQARYNLKKLVKYNPSLDNYIVDSSVTEQTINFVKPEAVYQLNKAILLADFKLSDYDLPKGYLIPPIPGRLDYLLHIQDFYVQKTGTKPTKVLDVGAGANAIYCILGAQQFNWNMVGAESDANAVTIAKNNIKATASLQNKVSIRHQGNKSFLFKGIIKPNERYDFTVCNPPFHSSKEEALKGSLRKQTNLNLQSPKEIPTLNFEGQANELWCNGGETLFIKRLIKESIHFKKQVTFFSSLVAKAVSLPKIEKQLTKAKAQYTIIPMELGNKKSRCVVWWF